MIRGKSDYGLVIFADKRYSKNDKRDKLPQWIRQFMRDGFLNLSSEGALHEARQVEASQSDQTMLTYNVYHALNVFAECIT